MGMKYKNFLIVFLFLFIIGSFVFKKFNNNEDEFINEITRLKDINKELDKRIDSLDKINDSINFKINNLKVSIDKKKDSLDVLNNVIKGIKDGKDKVNDNVNNMDINEFDNALTKYLNER